MEDGIPTIVQLVLVEPTLNRKNRLGLDTSREKSQFDASKWDSIKLEKVFASKFILNQHRHEHICEWLIFKTNKCASAGYLFRWYLSTSQSSPVCQVPLASGMVIHIKTHGWLNQCKPAHSCQK